MLNILKMLINNLVQEDWTLWAAFEYQAKTYKPCSGNFLARRKLGDIINCAIRSELTTRHDSYCWLSKKIKEWQQHKGDICIFFIDDSSNELHTFWYSDIKELTYNWEIATISAIPRLKRKVISNLI